MADNAGAAGPNQQALQALLNRHELMDEVERVGRCDGSDATLVKRYMEELTYVPDNLKLPVMRKTAMGDFRHEMEDFIRAHIQDHGPNVPYDEVHQHLLNAFVSLDIDEARKRELEKMRRHQTEDIVYFNRRFKTAMDEAYPVNARGPEIQKFLMRIYGRSLNSRRKATYLMAHGRPENIGAAMMRMRRKEEADVAFEQLGYDEEEPMEVAAVQPKNTSTTTTTTATALEYQRLQTHIAKLESKLDRLADLRGRGSDLYSDGRRNTGYSQGVSRANIQCYNCHAFGHYARECQGRSSSNSNNPSNSTSNTYSKN